MEKQKNFWDKNAGRYDCFMRKDAAAYEQMYELLRPVVRHKTVLELATGTGVIVGLFFARTPLSALSQRIHNRNRTSFPSIFCDPQPRDFGIHHPAISEPVENHLQRCRRNHYR